jgi:hypothetical protein
MAYADYTYYTGTYLGEDIPSASFARLSARASQKIDRLTFGRAADDEDYTDEIKMAMCAVADTLYSYEQGGSVSGIQSERVGDLSVTYAGTSSKQMPITAQCRQAAVEYLGSTGLMYAGFKSGEYGSSLDDVE